MNGRVGASVLQDHLLVGLDRHLRGLGFRPLMREQAFVRDVDGARWVVHASFVRHPTDVDAIMDLAVRLESVASLLEAVGYAKPGGATVGAELGNIVDGRPRRWTLSDLADCSEVAASVARVCEEFAIPWFTRFSDMASVLEVLTDPDERGWLYSPVHVKRCLTAIALAKRLGDPDRAERLAQACKEFLLARNDPQLPQFEKFAAGVLTS